MFRWLNRLLATRQLKKWQNKVESEWDPIVEIGKLGAVGIPYDQALAIMNLIANYPRRYK